MILRRLTENLRTQNWTAISIEFLIVVLGVFLGTQVSNWNEERSEKREIGRLLEQMRPEIARLRGVTASARHYYAITDRFADTALNGWNGDPKVSDRDFVIAAYQASQITGVANNATVFGAIFGAENLREIEDEAVRRSLAAIMTYDYALVDLRAVSSRYREEVRKTIPHSIQESIRARCGDRPQKNRVILPRRCDLQLPPDDAAKAADALRARPELLAELHWHRAAVANQLAQVDVLKTPVREFTSRIGDSPPQAGAQ